MLEFIETVAVVFVMSAFLISIMFAVKLFIEHWMRKIF